MGLSRFSDPEHVRVLTSPSWSHCEGLIKAFEDAWRRGERPAIAGYLHADGSQRRALLVELAHADLEFRLKAGQPARVEDYLADYPELAGDRNAVVGLIAAEYELRRLHQGGAGLDEYGGRFPEHLGDLLARLPGGAGDTPGPSGGAAPAAPPAPPALPGYEALREVGRGGRAVLQDGAGDPVPGALVRVGRVRGRGRDRGSRHLGGSRRPAGPRILAHVFHNAIVT
jgi:hypothetical protein